jgi:hypothetical protein
MQRYYLLFLVFIAELFNSDKIRFKILRLANKWKIKYKSKMELKEAIQILERHNKWRRGDIDTMDNPTDIGIAIDTVLHYAKKNLLATTLSEMGALQCEKNINKHGNT